MSKYEEFTTTLQITNLTRDVLKEVGRKSETYDQTILRILNEAGYETDKLIKEIKTEGN